MTAELLYSASFSPGFGLVSEDCRHDESETHLNVKVAYSHHHHHHTHHQLQNHNQWDQ